MNPHFLMALEIALDHFVTISDSLFNTQELGFVALFNRCPLGLSVHEWADLLVELQSQAYITFRQGSARFYPYAVPPLQITRPVLFDALQVAHDAPREDKAKVLSYALTPAGGKVWEDAAQADWTNYLEKWEGYGPEWEPVWGSINREEDPFAISDEEPSETLLEEVEEWGGPALERAQVLLSSQRRDLMEATYAVDADVLKIVVPGSRQDGEVRPWHPTYWKTLPLGYRLGYSVYSPPEREALSLPCTTNEERDEAQGFTPSWYRSVFPPHRMSN